MNVFCDTIKPVILRFTDTWHTNRLREVRRHGATKGIGIGGLREKHGKLGGGGGLECVVPPMVEMRNAFGLGDARIGFVIIMESGARHGCRTPRPPACLRVGRAQGTADFLNRFENPR